MKHFEKITIQIVIYEETLETISKCLNNLKKFKVIILDNANNYNLDVNLHKASEEDPLFLNLTKNNYKIK